jgi:hypothetical protein
VLPSTSWKARKRAERYQRDGYIVTEGRVKNGEEEEE